VKAHRISTAVHSHTTLRNVLVNPKDIMGDEEKVEVVYKIQCKNCNQSYIRETGRPLGIRVKEHRKEVDSITGAFTKAEKIRDTSICKNQQLQIDWDNMKVIDQETNRFGRQIRETIWITKTSKIN